MTNPKSAVAQLISRHIDMMAPRRTQREIAERAGFRRPNMMSMIRTGRAAVPFEKIPVIARELEIDPALLLRLHLKEVWPEFGAVVDQVLGGVLADQERKWIRFFEDSGLPEPPTSQKERDALASLISSGDWKEKQS